MTTLGLSGVRIRGGTHACPPDERLSYVEAKRQLGVRAATPGVCRVVAALALHEGPVPLTHRDLAESTGYTPAAISSVARFLFRTGVTEEGALIRSGSKVAASTILPAHDFDDRVNAVPAWQEEIAYRQLESRIGLIAEKLEVSRNEALSTVLDFYETNRPQPEQ